MDGLGGSGYSNYGESKYGGSNYGESKSGGGGRRTQQPLLLTQTQKDEMGNKSGPRRKVFNVKSNRKYYEQLKVLGPSLTTEPQYLHNENYVGDWERNLKHGFGTQTYGNGSKYEGEWRHGKREGKGTYWVKEGKKPLQKQYAGDWVNDRREGNGVALYPDGSSYEGGWQANKRHGQGRMEYASGEVYEGEWFEGLRSGYGVMRMANGDEFNGHWLGDKKEGPGRYLYYSTLKVYEGEWVDGSPKCGEYRSMTAQEAVQGGGAAAAAAAQAGPAGGGFALPELALKRPADVLSAAVTRARQERAARFAAPGEAAKTFTDAEVERCRAIFRRHGAPAGEGLHVAAGALRGALADAGGKYDEPELENLLWQLGADPETEISFSEFMDILGLLWV